MKDKPEKKKRRLPRVLGTVFLLAAAVLAVTLAVRSQQEGGIRALWREIFGSQGTDEFFFESAAGGQVADMDMGLAVAAGSGLYVYDKEGNAAFSRLYTYNSPAINTAGDYGAVWNVGGDTVIFFEKSGIIKELSFENPVVSASVNDLGYLAVCTEESGYYGSVTVYNYNATAIYRWYAGNARVLSAKVGGREELLVTTLGIGGSTLVLMRLDSEEQVADYTYSGLVVEAVFTDSGVAAVTDGNVIGLDKELQKQWEYDFSGRYLTHFSYRPGALALGLSDYQVGGRQQVAVISDGGSETGKIELTDEITDLYLAYDRVAILTNGLVTVYDTKLSELEKYECDPGAEHVILRENSTVLCAGTFSAYVYGK